MNTKLAYGLGYLLFGVAAILVELLIFKISLGDLVRVAMGTVFILNGLLFIRNRNAK